MKKIIAIDPGKNGGISYYKNNLVIAYDMPQTMGDIYELLTDIDAGDTVCYLEKVHGMPGQGGAAMFTFGQGFGWLQMALYTLNIPVIEITPQKWQKDLGIGTKGNQKTSEWKNKLKSVAQQLFPQIKVNLKTADSLLILNYAKKMEERR